MPEAQPDGNRLSSLYNPRGASGGGGQGGNYVFTDLAHLDSIIARWTSIRDRVEANGWKIQQAVDLVYPPADDRPSIRQAAAYINSLKAAREHNRRIVRYATGYIDKLQASRNQYATTEHDNADRLNNTDDT